jgi:hypothetical protein
MICHTLLPYSFQQLDRYEKRQQKITQVSVYKRNSGEPARIRTGDLLIKSYYSTGYYGKA